MKKTEMTAKIAETTGLKQKEVEAVLSSLSDELLKVIANNDSYKLGDVVTIKGIDKPARTARNPLTGATIQVPAKTGFPKAVFTKTAKE